MQIVRVAAKEFKGLKFVEILPKKTTTIVGGKNRAGKSSLLDSIAAALGGKKLCPEQPIRLGQDKGYVEVEVNGDESKLIPACTVRRDFWRKKSGEIESKLEIVTSEGYKAPSPQAMLADITGALGFDPESFLHMSAKEQAEMLRVLVGLDFTTFDHEYERVYAERKFVNASLVRLKVQLESTPHYPDAPAEEVSAAALVAELKERQKHNAENAAASRSSDMLASECDERNVEICKRKVEMSALAEKLHAIQEAVAKMEEALDQRQVALASRQAAVALLRDHDTAEVEQQIADSEVVNRKVRANAKRAAAKVGLDAEQSKSDGLTAKLKEIEATKDEMRFSAKWPVPGLGYNQDGVTYNNVPFGQCSGSEQRRVAVSIACALQPTLKFFFLKDGSLLDDEGKAEFARLAAENGCQCFMEVVGACDGTSLVIADGEVEWADAGILPSAQTEGV